MSDLEGIIPEESTDKDSSLMVSAFVERWIRKALLLHEAERNIPQDLNIDELVRDYRASLVTNNYEQLLVEQMLDSTITQEELTAFYEEHKAQYQLEIPIVRCYFIKMPKNAPNANSLRRWWDATSDAESFQNLAEYTQKYADISLLKDSKWYRVDEVAAYLPPGTLTINNIESKKDFIQRDDKYIYFFKAFEVVKKKEIAPLSYIEEQARKFILRQRKTALLQQIQEDMYEREMRKNNIKVYIQ